MFDTKEIRNIIFHFVNEFHTVDKCGDLQTLSMTQKVVVYGGWGVPFENLRYVKIGRVTYHFKCNL